MIQTYTRLRAADNSGAREILCIRVMKGSSGRYAGVGDIIIGAVKGATTSFRLPQAMRAPRRNLARARPELSATASSESIHSCVSVRSVSWNGLLGTRAE